MKRKRIRWQSGRGGGLLHTAMSSAVPVFSRRGEVVLMACLHKGTVCTEVTVHSTISTGQTAAPKGGGCAELLLHHAKEKKKSPSPLC